MKQIAVVAAIGLAGGLALARWLPQSTDDAAAVPEVAPGAAQGERTPALGARIDELERAIRDERQARQVLEEELLYLGDEIEQLQARGRQPGAATAAAAATVIDEGRRQRLANRNGSEARVARLVDAGFPADRAEWVVQRESRLRMAMLEARHEAQRNGGRFEGYEELIRREQQSFRTELGQADYERYLEATGRPTAVVVTSVMDTSPAQRVGLRPGDRILSYGNTRVYSMADLNRETLTGAAGETVYLQIERDGMPMQIALPRGPVGITGGGR